MCGVAGIFNLRGDAVSAVHLRRMTDAIIHRGPDDQGLFVDQYIGLGHRRLSIIDLSPAGHQPMSDPSGRYVISYNGEVYNYQELRVELEALGHQFHSQTDTEVVLHAYMQWGAKALTRFNGMFAFALWDKQEKCLLLARDRYGMKPLYYSLQDGLLLFASEIKAIIKHPHYKTIVDKEALAEYFTFQNFFTDKTLFKDVHILPAGSYVYIHLNQDQHLTIQQYWDFDFTQTEPERSEQETIEELDRLFQQAVSRQLVSDVEIGAYLSGGIDSGAITSIAAQQLPWMKTFTCGFDLHSASGIELGYDERANAEHLSYLFKTEQYEMVLKAGDMERILPRFAYHLEEPRVGQSYPNFYIAQLASKFVKVVLSGAGGDELFAGYPWRYYRTLESSNFENYIDRYYQFWQRLIPEHSMADIFHPIRQDIESVNTREIFKKVFKQQKDTFNDPVDYINQSLYFEAKTFLHGLLVVEDKLSMAHSLETRLPFLDNDLVDFALRIPTKFKLGQVHNGGVINENDIGPKGDKYFQQYHDGKLILRKMTARHLPSERVQAKKQGFSAPDASWFKGESINYIKSTLLNHKSPIYDYMDYSLVTRCIDRHLQGEVNSRLFIWSLLNFDMWLKTF